MRTQIKICCMASVGEAQLAIRAGADAVGFVCAIPTSRRSIDIESVAPIVSAVPPPTATFLLTTQTTAQDIAEQVLAAGVSTVQILARLNLSESKKLANLLPETQRVQVVHVENETAVEMIEPYAPYVHGFLLDSGRPNLTTPVFGGTGQTHDWLVSAEFVRRSPLPVFLAGGLTLANVAEAMRVVRPFGVDLCSGVRTDHRLDGIKLKAFIAAVHKADTELNR